MNRGKRLLRRRKGKVRRKVVARRSRMRALIPGSNTDDRIFIFEAGFIDKVLHDIRYPEMHRGVDKPAEVCGSFYVTRDSQNRYVIHHDSLSTSRKEMNERGFHRGTYDPEENIQFCHPRKNSANILWHAHPRGVPSYPSGSDVFVTMINDCTNGLRHLETAAQAFVEFLFTEYGFWVIHRGVDKDGKLMSAIDLTDTDGKPIRLNYHDMIDVEEVRSHVDTLMALLERKIMGQYSRTVCPDRLAVESINREINTNPVFHLIRGRTVLNFFSWDELENNKNWGLTLPGVLIDTPVTDVCLRA